MDKQFFCLSMILSCVVFAFSSNILQESVCGLNSFPYRISINRNGTPDLLCAKPSCQLEQYDQKCDSFMETVCDGLSQYTSGISEVNNGTHITLKTQCCELQWKNRGTIIREFPLSSGEMFVGGSKLLNGIEYFDIIKEIRKHVAKKRVQYVITIMRLHCNWLDKKSVVIPDVKKNIRRVPQNFFKIVKIFDKKSPSSGSYYRDQSSSLTVFRHNRQNYKNKKITLENTSPFVKSSLTNLQHGNKARDMKPLTEKKIYKFNVLSNLNKQRDESTYKRTTVNNFDDTNNPLLYDTAKAFNVQPGQNFKPSPVVEYSYVYPNTQEAYSYAAEYPNSPYVPTHFNSYVPSYTYNNGLNTIFNRMQCFSGRTQVETSAGSKFIKDLKIGDLVMTVEESMVTYSPVVMFLHRLDNELATFITLTLANSNQLSLTEHHLIYVTLCNQNGMLRLIPAKNVRIGDCVFVLNDQKELLRSMVVDISSITDLGIYSPLTLSGDIIVNNVLTSCHSNLTLKTLQQTFFLIYRYLQYIYKFFVFETTSQEYLPFGVNYLSTIIDIFLPSAYF